MGLFDGIANAFRTTTPSRDSSVKKAAVKDGVVLTKGTVVKGEIIDLRSKEVTVMLDNGKTLHARFDAATELTIGQVAEFYVEEADDVLITLKLLSDNDTTFAEAAIDNALEAAGLPKSENAVNIVRSLLDAGLPASKEMIQSMQRYMATNKGVDLSTLTALIKNHIPVTKENANALQSYRNYEHRLLSQAVTLTSSITEALTSGNTSENTFRELILSFYSSPADGDTAQATSQTAESLTSNTIHNAIDSTNVPQDSLVAQDINTEQASYAPQTNAQGIAASIITEDAPVKQASDSPSSNMLSAKEQEAATRLLQALPDATQDTTDLLTSLTNGNCTAKQLFSFLASHMKSHPDSAVGALLSKEPTLADAFSRELISQFLLTPEAITAENAIPEFYKNIESTLKQLRSIADTADQSLDKWKSISETSGKMQENLRFMNTLNEIFPYVQLPLHLTEQLTHGELYVYTKKKDLSARDSEVSVLLHLDMESLGPTDVHLSLYQSSVTATFYLTTEDATALIRESLPKLTDALQKKGYLLNASVQQREEKKDIINDFLTVAEATPMKRFRFDIRA